MWTLYNKFISSYIASSTQLEQTEEANGVVQTEIQSNHIVLEVTHILFQMLRVSPANEATLIGLFLYHLIIDLSRPNDMLPLVTKEFLDCYHPYPFIVGKAIYGVSRNNLLLRIYILFSYHTLVVPISDRCKFVAILARFSTVNSSYCFGNKQQPR